MGAQPTEQPIDRTDDLDGYLEQVRLRRAELGESMGALEGVLKESVADLAHWQERLRAALLEMHHDLVTHIEVTERPGGLYDSLREEAARLAGTLRRLQGEHPGLLAATDDLLARVAEGTEFAAGELTDVTAQVKDLLRRLGHHRQRGADLIFEAYQLDVGGLG